jgi:hypothetical protein
MGNCDKPKKIDLRNYILQYLLSKLPNALMPMLKAVKMKLENSPLVLLVGVGGERMEW